DETSLRARLQPVSVGIDFGPDALSSEGRALLDLFVRLVARLYPAVTLPKDQNVADLTRVLSALALAINPRIELDVGATVSVAVGAGTDSSTARFFAGSDGWHARVSRHKVQSVGRSNNPFGAG